MHALLGERLELLDAEEPIELVLAEVRRPGDLRVGGRDVRPRRVEAALTPTPSSPSAPSRPTIERSISSIVVAPHRPTSVSSSPRISSRYRTTPCLARRREPPRDRPAQQHGACAPSASALNTSRAAPHAAVEVDLEPALDRVDHLGQRVERRDRPVERSPAVVRHDDRVDAVVDRELRVLAGEDPLEHELHAGRDARAATPASARSGSTRSSAGCRARSPTRSRPARTAGRASRPRARS